MHKVVIIGSGGSGKSTLAKRLGAATGIPVHHLDALFWKPGWEALPKPQWREVQQHLCQEPEWIMDGDYGGTIDIRLAACDTVIFLDINRFICLFRVIKRAVRYLGRTRPDMAPDCKEHLDPKFLKWIFNYPKNNRPTVLKSLATVSDRSDVYVFRTQQDIERFLDNIALD